MRELGRIAHQQGKSCVNRFGHRCQTRHHCLKRQDVLSSVHEKSQRTKARRAIPSAVNAQNAFRYWMPPPRCFVVKVFQDQYRRNCRRGLRFLSTITTTTAKRKLCSPRSWRMSWTAVNAMLFSIISTFPDKSDHLEDDLTAFAIRLKKIACAIRVWQIPRKLASPRACVS